MSPVSKVYIAGVGFSRPASGGSSAKSDYATLTSAVTKALLDAGVTYDDVTRCTNSKDLKDASIVFPAFGEESVPIDEVEGEFELDSSFSQIQEKGAQCILLITTEESGAVALVLASEDFLWRHPYLKDSAVVLSKSESRSKGQAKKGLHSVCQMVWALRGWSETQHKAKEQEVLQFEVKSNQTFDLSRADSKPIPEWKIVEHRQDGKHRLRYNPATETRGISREDFEAVRSEAARGKGELQKQGDNDIQLKRQGGDRAALARL